MERMLWDATTEKAQLHLISRGIFSFALEGTNFRLKRSKAKATVACFQSAGGKGRGLLGDTAPALSCGHGLDNVDGGSQLLISLQAAIKQSQ